MLSGKSKSSIFNFWGSFLTSQSCWQSFCPINLTTTVSFFLLMRWQNSIWSRKILQPILSKIFKTLSSSTSPLTSQGMTTVSRHSRPEYWVFAQHCRSKVINLLGNNVLTFFVMDSSDLSLVIVSDELRTLSRTLL